ncbi:MAG: TolC family protein, partial [Terracidiphilus sp.]
MHFYRTGVWIGKRSAAGSERRGTKQNSGARGQTGRRLRAVAAVLLTLTATIPPGYAQQGMAGAGSKGPEKAASQLPAAPAPIPTQPIPLRTSSRDYSKAFATWFGNPINIYRPTSIPKASFNNSVRLADLMKDGKIYLSLSDALALAIENNYDIAIARYDLDIADTDILRARAGAPNLLGAPSGVLMGTLGGSTSTLSTGGGPGGTTVGSGGAGSGTSGLLLNTNGAGPVPQTLDPTLTGMIELQRQESPAESIFEPRASTNTNQYNFTYNQGFVTGTALQVGFNNQRLTTNNTFYDFSPLFSSSF